MRKLFVVLSLLVLASMVLAACGTPAPATTQPPAVTQPPVVTQPPTAPPETGPMSTNPDTFVEATFGEPETLDPALDYETAGASIIQNTYDTMIFYKGEEAGEFVPQLATDWKISDDGKDYTFTIRQGVTFHNGDPMNTSDVAYSLQRALLQGGTASPMWLFYEAFFGTGFSDIAEIVEYANANGADSIALANGPLDSSTVTGSLDDDNAGVAASDPAVLTAVCQRVKDAIVADTSANTVTLHLVQPWGPMMATLAQSWASVMDQKWVTDNGGWDGSCDTWTASYGITSENDPFSALENGTGPFKLDHWTKGQEIVLTRNDNYWRTEPAYDGGPSGPAKLASVVIKNVNEWGTRFAMLQAGDADVVAVPVENRSQADALVGEDCKWNDGTGQYDCTVVDNSKPLLRTMGRPTIVRTDVFLNFNISNPDGANPYIGSGQLDGNGIPVDFFSDVHVRKAFNYCFDWDTFINDVFNGEAIQSTAIPIPGMPGYSNDAPHYTYDPDKCTEEFKASTLTAADGTSLWDEGFRMSAVYNQGNTTRQKVAEILASNINAVNDKFIIETVGLPWPTFLQAQRAKTLPMFISGWLEDIQDPHNWYVPYLIQTYGSRQSLPADLKAQFKDLINQGVSLSDPAARDAVYQQLNQLVYDNAPDIILAIGTTHGFVQRWVHGLVRNPIFPDIYYYGISKD